MCNYLYSAIDWQAEGVSMDNIDKIKKVKDRLIGFDRQKRGADQMFYKLPADRETQTVIEAFLEWNVLGKRSWNFDEADRCVYRVQLWTEKIKKPLIEAITTFENREIDYFKCAMMAEFYRIILFGSSKATTVEGLKSEHILDNGIRGLGVNSHSDAWNSLLGIITRSENDKINRETVIQYCNVIQGESHAQVFLDREKFDAMVRNVKSERLTIEPAILDLVDPVKPRRDVRDYLRVILERLEKVQEDELAKADSIMATIKENFGTTDVDDEDIEDMVEKIVEFYRTAEDGKLPGKYDQELFDEVKKYSTSTSKAIKEIVVAQKTSNALDCIMAFSQDPIRKVEKLDQLLKKVTADIVKIQAELEVRKAKLGGGSNPSGSENVFENEKTIISECSCNFGKLGGGSMLIDTLNERIIDMKTVHEMETASADTKKQAMADYNFKQLILNLKQMVDEVNLAVENSDFRPSANVISALKSFLGVCEKVVQTGVANNATTQYISFESKKLYTVIGQEWSEFYLKATANILSLLDTVKGIIPDENKAIYATNKIKKASSWNVTIDNYNYLKQGIAEADKILEDLDLDEDSEILAFLKLVSEGKATILNLTDEILAWIKAENLADKMFINF